METPVLDRPRIYTGLQQETSSDLPWNVILYNDDYHTIQEVVLQVQKATGVPLETAFEMTMEVHTKGQTCCYHGTYTACERVAAVLREIHLTVAIVQTEA